MFRGINLCGAEANTKFSEQHRTHLLHCYIRYILASFPIDVKSSKPLALHKMSVYAKII